jgi:hypothetical protein
MLRTTDETTKWNWKNHKWNPKNHKWNQQMTNCSPKDKGWQRKVPSYDNRTSYSYHRGIENIEEGMILFRCFFL